jgi:hypothetical protein
VGNLPSRQPNPRRLDFVHRRLQFDSHNAKADMVGAAGSEPAAVEKYVKQNGINYPLYLDVDEKNGMGRIYRWFQIDSVPRSVLVGADGAVVVAANLEGVLEQVCELAKPNQ